LGLSRCQVDDEDVKLWWRKEVLKRLKTATKGRKTLFYLYISNKSCIFAGLNYKDEQSKA
jgi:hypothetical protein